jgi:hypothetical protein
LYDVDVDDDGQEAGGVVDESAGAVGGRDVRGVKEENMDPLSERNY